MIKIKNTIRRKYNNLYKELAIFYNMEDKISISPIDSMYFITPHGFGINQVTTTAEEMISHLEQYRPYFVPFYKFRVGFYLHFHEISIETILQDINSVIKKIRKEK